MLISFSVRNENRRHINSHFPFFQYFFKSIFDKYKKAQQQLNSSRSSEQDWNLLQTCISLLQHIGDFRMKLTDFEKKVSDIIVEKGRDLQQRSDQSLDRYFVYKISGKSEIAELRNQLECAQVSSNPDNPDGVLSSVFLEIKPVCEYVHDITLASIFVPIEYNLKTIISDQVADAADLPDYSFAPQEFITVVGQVSQNEMK